MNGRKGYLILAVMFLMAATLNALNINFDALDWLEVVPAILFAIIGIFYIREFLKKRKTEASENG